MAQGRLRKGLEQSVKHAVACGNLNEEKCGATLSMLRYMADCLDGNAGSENAQAWITPASYLSYCEKLGFTAEDKKAQGVEVSKLSKFAKYNKKAS